MSLGNVVDHSTSVLRFLDPLSQSTKWREVEKTHPFTRSGVVADAKSSNAVVYSRGAHRFIVKAKNENTLLWSGRDEQGTKIPASAIQHTIKGFFTSLTDVGRASLALSVLGCGELNALADRDDISMSTDYNVSSIHGILKSKTVQPVSICDCFCPTPGVVRFNEFLFKFEWANGDSWEKENSLSDTALVVSAYLYDENSCASCEWINKTEITLPPLKLWWTKTNVWATILNVTKRFASPSFTVRNPFESVNQFESSTAAEKINMIVQLLWRKGSEAVVTSIAEILDNSAEIMKPFSLPEHEQTVPMLSGIYSSCGFDVNRFTRDTSLVMYNDGHVVIRDGDTWAVLPLFETQDGKSHILWDLSKWKHSKKDSSKTILPLSICGALRLLASLSPASNLVSANGLKSSLSKLEDKELKEIYARLFTELDAVKGAARPEYEPEVHPLSLEDVKLSGEMDAVTPGTIESCLQLIERSQQLYLDDRSRAEEEATQELEDEKKKKEEQKAAPVESEEKPMETDEDLQKRDPLAAILKRKGLTEPKDESVVEVAAPKPNPLDSVCQKKYKLQRIFSFAERIRQRAVYYLTKSVLKNAANSDNLTDAIRFVPKCINCMEAHTDKSLEADLEHLSQGAETPFLVKRDSYYAIVLFALHFKNTPCDAAVKALRYVVALGVEGKKTGVGKFPQVFKRVSSALQAVGWNRLSYAACGYAISLFPDLSDTLFTLGIAAARKASNDDPKLGEEASKLLSELTIAEPKLDSHMETDGEIIVRSTNAELSIDDAEFNQQMEAALNIFSAMEGTDNDIPDTAEFCGLVTNFVLGNRAHTSLINLVVRESHFTKLLEAAVDSNDEELFKLIIAAVRNELNGGKGAVQKVWNTLRKFMCARALTLPTSRLLAFISLLRGDNKRPASTQDAQQTRPPKAAKTERGKEPLPAVAQTTTMAGAKGLTELANALTVEYFRRLPDRRGEKLDAIRQQSFKLSDTIYSNLTTESLLLFLRKECQRSDGTDLPRDVTDWLILKFASPKCRTDKRLWDRVIGLLKEFVSVIPITSGISAIGDSIGLYKDAAELVLARYKKSIATLDGPTLKIITRNALYNALKTNDAEFLLKMVRSLKEITNESLRDVVALTATSLWNSTVAQEKCSEIANRCIKVKGVFQGVDEGPGTEKLTTEQKGLVRKAVYLTGPNVMGSPDMLLLVGERLVTLVSETFPTAAEGMIEGLQSGLSEFLKWARSFATHEKGDCEIIVRSYKRIANKLPADLKEKWEKTEESKP